jgi:hypothetical protein
MNNIQMILFAGIYFFLVLSLFEAISDSNKMAVYAIGAALMSTTGWVYKTYT